MPPARTSFNKSVEASGGSSRIQGGEQPLRLAESQEGEGNTNSQHQDQQQGSQQEQQQVPLEGANGAKNYTEDAEKDDERETDMIDVHKANKDLDALCAGDCADGAEANGIASKKQDEKINGEDADANSHMEGVEIETAKDEKSEARTEDIVMKNSELPAAVMGPAMLTSQVQRKASEASAASATASSSSVASKHLEVHVNEEDDQLLYGARSAYVADSLDVANRFEIIMRVENFHKTREEFMNRQNGALSIRSEPVVTPDGFKFGLMLFPNGIAAKPNLLALFLEWCDPAEELQRRLGADYSRKIDYRLEVVKHPLPPPVRLGSKRKRQDVKTSSATPTSLKPSKPGDQQDDSAPANGDAIDSIDDVGESAAKRAATDEGNKPVSAQDISHRMEDVPGPNGNQDDCVPDSKEIDKENASVASPNGSPKPNGVDHESPSGTEALREAPPSSENILTERNGVNLMDIVNESLEEDGENSLTGTSATLSAVTPSFNTTLKCDFSSTDDWRAKNTDWGSNELISVDHLKVENGLLDADGALVLRAVATPYFDRSHYDTKEATGKVGLENDGATCYLNSLLQTLFMTKRLRREVYDLDTTHEKAKNGVALELQRLFWQLQTSDMSVSTRNLTTAFGWKSAFLFRQHDVQEMNRELVDKLEERMKGTSSENLIKELYTGKMRSYIKCINVNFESARDEEFYDIQLDVKNMQNVYEAFAKYIEVERLEGDNQYEAEGHGKQDAHKGVGFLSFPPVLNLHLKRFEFDLMTEMTVKINDEFRFPVHMRLDQFLHESVRRSDEEIEADPQYEYVLHSVLVHWGDVNSGHYYAFINDMTQDGLSGEFKSRWLKFDDEKVFPASKEMAVSNNFGGHSPDRYTSHGNAYMLVYIRKDALSDVLMDVPEESVPRALLDRFQKDEEEERLRQEEEDRKRATVCFRYITHKTLRKFYGYERGPRFKDLIDFFRERDSKQIELKKKSTVEDLLKQLAPTVDAKDWRQVRIWTLISRENNSFRVDKAYGEPDANMTLSEVFNFSSAQMMPKCDIFVEGWEASVPLSEMGKPTPALPPWPLPEDFCLIFFRQWRPGPVGIPKKLEHVGHALISKHASYSDVVVQIAKEILPKIGVKDAPSDESKYNLWELWTTRNINVLKDGDGFIAENNLMHGDIVIFEILPETEDKEAQTNDNAKSDAIESKATSQLENEKAEVLKDAEPTLQELEVQKEGSNSNKNVKEDIAETDEISKAVALDKTPTVFFDKVIFNSEPEDTKLEPRCSRAASCLEVLDDQRQVAEFGPIRVRGDFNLLTSVSSYVRALDLRFVVSVVNRLSGDMDTAIRMELTHTMKTSKARSHVAHALALLGIINKEDQDRLRLCTFNNHITERKFSIDEPTSSVVPSDNLHRTVRQSIFQSQDGLQEYLLGYELLPCHHEQVDRVVEAHYIQNTYPRTSVALAFLESSHDALEQGYKLLGDSFLKQLGCPPDSKSVRWIVEESGEVQNVYGLRDVGDPMKSLHIMDRTRASHSLRIVADLVHQDELSLEVDPGILLCVDQQNQTLSRNSSDLPFSRPLSSIADSQPSPLASPLRPSSNDGEDDDLASKTNGMDDTKSDANGRDGDVDMDAETTEAEGESKADEPTGAGVAPPEVSSTPPPPPSVQAPSLSSSPPASATGSSSPAGGMLVPRLVVVRHFHSPTPSKLKRAKIFGLPLTLIVRSGDTSKDLLNRATKRLGLEAEDTQTWRLALMNAVDPSCWSWLDAEGEGDEDLRADADIFADTMTYPVLGLFHPNPQRETSKVKGGLLSKGFRSDLHSPTITSRPLPE